MGSARRIVDLFAGSGTFSLPLSEQAEVHAVEGDAAMMAALEKGWRQTPGLKKVTTETRDLFRRPLEPDELKGVDAVVIDPPRAGAEAQIAVLSRLTLPVIALVSCNPITFARDAARWCGRAIGSTGFRSWTSSAGHPTSNLLPDSADDAAVSGLSEWPAGQTARFGLCARKKRKAGQAQ